MNNLDRYAYGNLLNAMDRCDPTRSHESIPSIRLAYLFRGRRFVRRFYGCLSLAAALLLLAAIL